MTAARIHAAVSSQAAQTILIGLCVQNAAAQVESERPSGRAHEGE